MALLKRRMTPKALESRRRNAAHSTGPRTAVGKFHSAVGVSRGALCSHMFLEFLRTTGLEPGLVLCCLHHRRARLAIRYAFLVVVEVWKHHQFICARALDARENRVRRPSISLKIKGRKSTSCITDLLLARAHDTLERLANNPPWDDPVDAGIQRYLELCHPSLCASRDTWRALPMVFSMFDGTLIKRITISEMLYRVDEWLNGLNLFGGETGEDVGNSQQVVENVPEPCHSDPEQSKGEESRFEDNGPTGFLAACGSSE